jgi:SAM-dependent methyltransferase
MQTEQYKLHADIEEKHWWFVARRKIVYDLLKKIVPPSRDKMVVDIGCGTGANIANLAREYSCFGVDTSPEAISFAQSRFPDVKFLCMPEPAEILSGTHADVCLLMDVIEHVPDDFMLFSKLLSLSAPGTYFILTVPANMSLWSEHDVSFGHYRRYDMQRLKKVWEGLPVEIMLASYYNSRLYPLVKMARILSRMRGHAQGESGTDLSMPPSFVNNMMEKIFAGETQKLSALLTGKEKQGYSSGVSIVAVIRRGEGNIAVRENPDGPDTLKQAAVKH